MAEQSGPLPLTEEQLAQVIDEKTFHARSPMCASSRIGSAPALPSPGVWLDPTASLRFH
jgi:hypothetical protein